MTLQSRWREAGAGNIWQVLPSRIPGAGAELQCEERDSSAPLCSAWELQQRTDTPTLPGRTDGHGPKGVPACGKTDERSQSPARSPPREVRIMRFTFKARERTWKERGETRAARKPRGSAPQSGSLAHHLQTDRRN